MVINLPLLPAGLLAGLGLLVLPALDLSAHSAVAKRFGSREPHTCSSRKAPTSGALSSAQATQYFLCDFEHSGGSEGRRFNVRTDSFTGVDNSQPAFDIRGSYDEYFCTFIGDVNGQPGKNCTLGDWHCVFSDASVGPSQYQYNVAPPAN